MKVSELPNLEPADIMLEWSPHFVSRLIRFGERDWTKGEEVSEASHAAMVTGTGTDGPWIVEALASGITARPLTAYAGSDSWLLLARPLNVEYKDKLRIVSSVREFVGKRYGFARYLGHALRWLTGGPGIIANLFGKIGVVDCSSVVALAYASAGLNFGVKAGAAQPDDILDFIRTNGDKYSIVREWFQLEKD